jgi:hemerythrin
MALLTFDKTYSVGIQSIDDQHAFLFDSLNELHAAILKGQEKSVTARLLDDLLAYTRSHFSAEESMLAKARYPGLVEHHAIHLKLTVQVADYAQRFKRGEAAVSVHLVTFLRDWLTNHILREDRAYGGWLTQAGIHL